MHSLAGVETNDKLRKLEQDGYAAIVKAAPELRQYFCLFLRVDRNRAEGNRGQFPIVCCYYFLDTVITIFRSGLLHVTRTDPSLVGKRTIRMSVVSAILIGATPNWVAVL